MFVNVSQIIPTHRLKKDSTAVVAEVVASHALKYALKLRALKHDRKQ
jgi:hypothetical protein